MSFKNTKGEILKDQEYVCLLGDKKEQKGTKANSLHSSMQTIVHFVFFMVYDACKKHVH